MDSINRDDNCQRQVGLNKRKIRGGENAIPPLPSSQTWDQPPEQKKAEQKNE